MSLAGWLDLSVASRVSTWPPSSSSMVREETITVVDQEALSPGKRTVSTAPPPLAVPAKQNGGRPLQPLKPPGSVNKVAKPAGGSSEKKEKPSKSDQKREEFEFMEN